MDRREGELLCRVSKAGFRNIVHDCGEVRAVLLEKMHEITLCTTDVENRSMRRGYPGNLRHEMPKDR